MNFTAMSITMNKADFVAEVTPMVREKIVVARNAGKPYTLREIMLYILGLTELYGNINGLREEVINDIFFDIIIKADVYKEVAQ